MFNFRKHKSEQQLEPQSKDSGSVHFSPVHNRRTVKLPAWIGSILFHTTLLLLILFWFSLAPTYKAAPGDRIAVGSIVMQSPADAREQSESSPAGSESTDSPADAALSESLTTTSLDLPPNLALAPGQQAETQAGAESATELTEAFQQGSSVGTTIGAGETTVQVFGTQGTGTKFMYVFDRSGSMEGKPIQRAKAELLRSLAALNELHQFNIVFYSTEWQLWQKGRKLIFATLSEKQSADRFVKSIVPYGNTRHFEPLMEAIAHRPDVIFFLTDGQGQDNLTAAQLQTLERASSRWGAGVQINVIQFGSGGLIDVPSEALKQLAAQSHGEYQYVNVRALP